MPARDVLFKPLSLPLNPLPPNALSSNAPSSNHTEGDVLAMPSSAMADAVLGALLGAALGVTLIALMGASSALALPEWGVSGPATAWGLGALIGGLVGGFLSALIGWELADEPIFPPDA